MPGLTPFQTVGPYLSIGLRVGVAPADRSGQVVIRGRLIDGAGQPIPDGIIEWWHPTLPGVMRSLTSNDGEFAIAIVKPRGRHAAGQVEAPHVAVRILARGILTQYATRMYFSDEPATVEDAVLHLVPEARRHTLIAERQAENEYRFDVIVQGDNETVFFEI